MVKHKSAHGCASAIFYDLGPKTITQSCNFKYIFDASVPPTILDGGKELLFGKFVMDQDLSNVTLKMVG